MNAKKKNPKPVGKTQQKRSKPNALPQPDPLRRELGQTLEIELERQEKLKRKLQAAGTAPSDDVIRTTESLYSSARSLLGLIEKQQLPDSKGDIDTIELEKRFCGFAAWVIEELGALARRGHYDPLRAAWHGGQVLAETIHDVALDNPLDSQFTLLGLRDLQSFLSTLPQRPDPVSHYLWGRLTGVTQNALRPCQTSTGYRWQPVPALITEFNQIIDGPSIYDGQRFNNVCLSRETHKLLANIHNGIDLRQLNLLLLEDAYPEIPWYPHLGNLRRIARAALYMPSLRVNTKIFKHDFDKVANKIQLSKDHTIRVDPQAEYQLDRSATRFIVKMIERFTFLRKRLAEKKEEYLQFKHQPQATPDLKGALKLPTLKLLPLTLENWLAWDFNENMVSELLLCEDIKPLTRDTADEWLKQFLTPFVKLYPRLWELTGIPYYNELLPAATVSKSSKPYGVRDELLKRCRQVLEGKTFFPESVA
jgi:hypothetical protein